MATTSINNIASAIYELSIGKEGSELSKVSNDVTLYLAKNNLLGKAPQIIHTLENIIDKNEGIVRVKVSSKDKLNDKITDEIKDIIKKKYKAKDVILTLNIDQNLIGGIKIEAEDDVIDMTLKNKLSKLQNYLNKN